MNIIGWIIAVAVVLVALFAVANWSLITAPAALNLLAFTIEGPLGLILLAAAFLLMGLCGIYVLSVRTSALIETRKSLRELEAQRAVADSAEASRLAELSAKIDTECARLHAANEALRVSVTNRIDALETTLAQAFRDHANGLFANIGQIDEKLTRLSRPGGETRS